MDYFVGSEPRQTTFRSIHHTGALFLSLCFLSSTLLSSVQADPEQGTSASNAIRVNVDRVNVDATVTGVHGSFIKGLRREDFHIFDDGVEQPITDFHSIEQPAQVVLLIETGPALLIFGKSHMEAADALLTALSTDDSVAIATYSDAPQLFLDFTTDKTAARFALKELNTMASLGRLNLSSSIAVTLDWLSRLPGKKNIVVISSGVDTSSTNSEVLRLRLATSDIRILGISMSGAFPKTAKRKVLSLEERDARNSLNQEFAEADSWLHTICATTGGRTYSPKSEKEFVQAYAEIARLLRGEYTLEFAPTSFDGRIHAITVKVKHARYRVDHRQAYFARPQPADSKL